MPPLGFVDGTVDAVGEGDGGVLMSVGVGTGGSVSGGSGEIDSVGKPVVALGARDVPGTTTAAGAEAEVPGRGLPV